MNIVFIMTDRHNPEFSSCYGSPITRTPHIDSLAERGTRFEHTYCLSPLCAPSRAAMIAGRYVHEIGTWDNAFPYTGTPRGWAHYFADHGVHFTTIGKLDFQPGANIGIADARLSKYRDSLDIHSLFRQDGIQPRYHHLHRLRAAGPTKGSGEHDHDRQVIEETEHWLAHERPTDQPFILIVNIKQPHPPWNPPRALWDHYNPLVKFEDLDERYTEDPLQLHPFHRDFTRYTCSDLATPEELRRGIAAYHATCEMADRNVGRVLSALDKAGIAEETLIAYSSDHGGSVGAHVNSGMGSMYEDSIRVPLIIAGPGIQSNAVESTPVSHLDLYQTFCEALTLPPAEHMRGISLLGLLQGEPNAPKPLFALSEFHGAGLPSSMFAIRSDHFKYVECVNERPILFDLKHDPHEMHDLVLEQPKSANETIQHLRKLLYQTCSPESIDARAKSDQHNLRTKLTQSGQLVDEMWKRGYERNPTRLVPRQEKE